MQSLLWWPKQAKLSWLLAEPALVAKAVATETTKGKGNVLAHRKNTARGGTGAPSDTGRKGCGGEGKQVARGRFPWAKTANGEAGDVGHPERSEVLTELLQGNGSHHARVNGAAATIKTGMWTDGDRSRPEGTGHPK